MPAVVFGPNIVACVSCQHYEAADPDRSVRIAMVAPRSLIAHWRRPDSAPLPLRRHRSMLFPGDVATYCGRVVGDDWQVVTYRRTP